MTIRVGFFDSGIGGFSLLRELFAYYKNWEVFYIADNKNAPYGSKSEQFVVERSIELVQTLLKFQVDLIVVACNTATALSIEILRQKFPLVRFVGIEPYLNVINRHAELLQYEKGVVLSTVLTNSSPRFMQLRQRLDPDDKLDYVGLHNLAMIIEDAFLAGDVDFNRRVVEELHFLQDKKYDFAILGCTHYPLVASSIKKVLQVGKVYDPSEFVIKRAISLLQKQLANYSAAELASFAFMQTRDGVWTRHPLI